MDLTVAEIARLVDGVVVGNDAVRITGVNGIREAANGDISFIGSAKYLKHLATTRAAAILVERGCTGSDRPLIQVDDPYRAFVVVLSRLELETRLHPRGIHPGAIISDRAAIGADAGIDALVRIEDDAVIGDRAVLYSGVYIGRGVHIGADTVLYPNVVVRDRVRIGDRCIIHGNATLGSDGFGFAPVAGRQVKIPQVGTVIVGDDVEIGANTAIDRATCGETVIGNGTKIDNLVQVGHNVRIGEHCAISGGVAIAGSATIGNRVTIGGLTGIAGHIEIGDGATIAARSGVTKSIPAGALVSGFPAEDHHTMRRFLAAQKHLPGALRRIRELEERIRQLEPRNDG